MSETAWRHIYGHVLDAARTLADAGAAVTTEAVADEVPGIDSQIIEQVLFIRGQMADTQIEPAAVVRVRPGLLTAMEDHLKRLSEATGTQVADAITARDEALASVRQNRGERDLANSALEGLRRRHERLKGRYSALRVAHKAQGALAQAADRLDDMRKTLRKLDGVFKGIAQEVREPFEEMLSFVREQQLRTVNQLQQALDALAPHNTPSEY